MENIAEMFANYTMPNIEKMLAFYSMPNKNACEYFTVSKFLDATYLSGSFLVFIVLPASKNSAK